MTSGAHLRPARIGLFGFVLSPAISVPGWRRLLRALFAVSAERHTWRTRLPAFLTNESVRYTHPATGMPTTTASLCDRDTFAEAAN